MGNYHKIMSRKRSEISMNALSAITLFWCYKNILGISEGKICDEEGYIEYICWSVFLSFLDFPYLDDIVQIIKYIIRILGKCKILLGKILQNK